MTHKNKRGFTLIELLAVIVILAVIALIATPIILNMVENAKKGAAKDSAYGYIEAIEYNIGLSDYNDNYTKYKDGTYEISEISLNNLKGKQPTYGDVTITKGRITYANICINEYMVEYDGKKATVLIKCTEQDSTGPEIVIGQVSGTSNSITIPFIVQDNETGIKEVICKYGIDGKYTETGIIENNECKIKKLKSNVEYNYKIQATNKAGKKSEQTGIAKTVEFESIGIEITPEDEWATKREVTITGKAPGAKLQYQLNGTDGEWIIIESGTTLTFNENVTIYIVLTDEINKSQETLVISTIDTSAPSLTVGNIIKTTKSITIPYTSEDEESGIKETTCSYGTSTSYGSEGTIEDGKCVINKVSSGTTYYYKITTTNNAGTTTEQTGNTDTVETGTCSISITDENTWTTSKTATISGNISTGESLQYKVLSGTTEKIGWTTVNSGKTATIDWNATLDTPTHVYCRVTDGDNTKDGETKTITTIDSSAPTLTLGDITTTTKSITIPYTAEDKESGIKETTCSYGTSISYRSEGIIEDGKCIISKATSGTTYYYKITTENIVGTITDVIGNTDTIETGTCSISITDENTWTTSKTATISGNISTGESLQYKVLSGTTEKIGWTTVNSGKTATIDWTSTTSTPTYIYCRVTDGKNTKDGQTKTITTIDRDNPTTPTVTYNSGSNSCSWKNNYNLTLSSSDISIAHYEIDVNGDGTSDGTTGASFIPSNGWSSCNVRFRAVDHVGNKSGWTGVHHIHQDTQAPGTPTVTYNGGSNSCSWKNNYNISLSATENVGVAHYEIDWSNDGVAETTTGSNFIPWNGYHSCGTRFRAVDHAGNKGSWTAVQHIHMDTEAPGKTSVNLNGYSSGAWTNGNVTQTASASDNVGIAYYQYSHDGSSVANTFPNPWTINWDGQWNFYVRAVDHAGNAGAWSNVYTIRRDATAPTTPTLTGTSDGNWVRQTLYIKPSSTDTGGSGINRYEAYYSGAWHKWCSANLSDCNYFENDRNETVRFRAIDNVGNVSGESSTVVRVDKTAPQIDYITSGTRVSRVCFTEQGSGMRHYVIAYSTTKYTTFTEVMDNPAQHVYQTNTSKLIQSGNQLCYAWSSYNSSPKTFATEVCDTVGNCSQKLYQVN